MHLIREFYADWDLKDLDSEKIRGQVVTFSAYDLNAILGTPKADSLKLRQLNITLPYTNITHLLCSNRSIVRWIHHREGGYHMTFLYVQMNRKARMWLKIIYLCLIIGKDMTEVTRDRVCLIYALMQEGFRINMGAVIISAMKNALFHQGCKYGFGGLLTQF